MDHIDAQRVIESFRKGIPPDGFVRHFTVGRTSKIKQLIGRLNKAVPGALLLKANYGSGKTHLLRFIREWALENGFAVSAVTLDAKGAVRFNRMDQVFGAICRNIEVPGASGKKGIRPVLDHVVDHLIVQRVPIPKDSGTNSAATGAGNTPKSWSPQRSSLPLERGRQANRMCVIESKTGSSNLGTTTTSASFSIPNSLSD